MGQYQQWLHYQTIDRRLSATLDALEQELASLESQSGDCPQSAALLDNPIISCALRLPDATSANGHAPSRVTMEMPAMLFLPVKPTGSHPMAAPKPSQPRFCTGASCPISAPGNQTPRNSTKYYHLSSSITLRSSCCPTTCSPSLKNMRKLTHNLSFPGGCAKSPLPTEMTRPASLSIRRAFAPIASCSAG